MSHDIQAIVAKGKINHEPLMLFDLPCFFHEGFSIVGLNPYHSDHWTEKLSIYKETRGRIILNCPVTHYFARELGVRDYAIISTNYFGGVGKQYATVLSSGNVVMEEKEGAINEALKLIGVTKKEALDEFDTICLSRYRSFDAYFERYF